MSNISILFHRKTSSTTTESTTVTKAEGTLEFDMKGIRRKRDTHLDQIMGELREIVQNKRSWYDDQKTWPFFPDPTLRPLQWKGGQGLREDHQREEGGVGGMRELVNQTIL